MKIVTILFLLNYFLPIFAKNLTEIEYNDGVSIEPIYHLPQINVSLLNGSVVGVTANLRRILDIFNTELLEVHWLNIRGFLSENCAKDLDLYLDGLKRSDNWALKMDDASGRYATGWFWGNHYWTGSQGLCDNIVPRKRPIIVDSENRTHLTTSKADQNSPSLAAGFQMDPIIYSSIPPFPVSFFMMRIRLNTTFSNEERILHIGQCMPYICTDDDIKVLTEKMGKISGKIDIKVETVKSHHNYYDIWQDRTFKILCTVTTLVILLLISATSYDFYRDYLEKKRKTTFGQHLKLDMSMPDVKTKNLYVVNNNNNNNIEVTIENITTKSTPTYILILEELLMAFSLRTNIRTIFDQTVGTDTIPVIHGLKSISMAWVILGHTCIVAFKYSDNMEYRKVVQRDFFFQTITNGAFSVDTFFFTSGLLVSFLYFRTNAKGKLDPLNNGHGLLTGLYHFFGLIAYRFARLTVPYLFTVGIVEVTMKWFNFNSVFEPPTLDHINCPNYWWRNVLYINTLFPVEEMCMLWSWYLSDDTQFYVVGAILLILATKHFKSSASLLVIFMASSWITTGYIAFSNSHRPGADDPLALFDKIYDKPWTRLGPYLVGMCAGWLLFKKNCRIIFSKLSLTAGWCGSLGCLLLLVYGLYEVNLTPLGGAAYSSLSHTMWAVALAWIVIACSTGYGGFINTILSSTILYPFSRVTYCAYLLHPVVIRMMAMSMDSPLHLGSLVMIIIFMGQVVAAYSLSFFVSLAFEAPVVCMLRTLTKIVTNKHNGRSLPS